jgi:hypothetical protein
MELSACLASIEAALEDADATLSTRLADHQELTSARLWRGQVLVDWEPDAQAGGSLLRAAVLRRLIALHATAMQSSDGVTLRAPGRVVAGLSPDHAGLVQRLGGARRVELQVRLRFVDGEYRGGEETYFVQERGQRVPVVKITVDVRVRSARPASPRTSLVPR